MFATLREKEEDHRFDEWYDFRVVEKDGFYYVQREYCVPGYDKLGNYDPCIKTGWMTLVDYIEILRNRKVISNESLGKEKSMNFKKFTKLPDILRYWKNEKSDYILQSQYYYASESLGDTNYVCTRNDLMKEYPESLI